MIALCLLLSACGGAADGGNGYETAQMRMRYDEMSGCTMEATVSCDQEGCEWEADLRCDYVPGGETVVEVLEPETIRGVKAILDGGEVRLEYEDLCLNAGTLSTQALSPMECLPRLMDALRDGWLLEENREKWQETECVRITVDQSGTKDGKIISTLWLRRDDGTPLRGEIAVDGKNILRAEFTGFAFYDTLAPQKN